MASLRLATYLFPEEKSWDNETMAERNATLSLPERLRLEIEEAARAQGRSVNELLADAVDRYLSEQQWLQLKAYGLRKAREQRLTEADVDTAIAESHGLRP